MGEGRSKTWLTARAKVRRDGVEIVAMDEFTGFKTAAAKREGGNLTHYNARLLLETGGIQAQIHSQIG